MTEGGERAEARPRWRDKGYGGACIQDDNKKCREYVCMAHDVGEVCRNIVMSIIVNMPTHFTVSLVHHKGTQVRKKQAPHIESKGNINLIDRVSGPCQRCLRRLSMSVAAHPLLFHPHAASLSCSCSRVSSSFPTGFQSPSEVRLLGSFRYPGWPSASTPQRAAASADPGRWVLAGGAGVLPWGPRRTGHPYTHMRSRHKRQLFAGAHTRTHIT